MGYKRENLSLQTKFNYPLEGKQFEVLHFISFPMNFIRSEALYTFTYNIFAMLEKSKITQNVLGIF